MTVREFKVGSGTHCGWMVDVYRCNVYLIKFDFEQGFGTENHELYYFIKCTRGFWIYYSENLILPVTQNPFKCEKLINH